MCYDNSTINTVLRIIIPILMMTMIIIIINTLVTIIWHRLPQITTAMNIHLLNTGMVIAEIIWQILFNKKIQNMLKTSSGLYRKHTKQQHDSRHYSTDLQILDRDFSSSVCDQFCRFHQLRCHAVSLCRSPHPSQYIPMQTSVLQLHCIIMSTMTSKCATSVT